MLSLSIVNVIYHYQSNWIWKLREPEDEELCKAVTIIINMYIDTLDIIIKQLANTWGTLSYIAVSILFVIPVIVDLHGHRFEIYNLVSEVHTNVDMVLGIMNIYKMESVINTSHMYIS